MLVSYEKFAQAKEVFLRCINTGEMIDARIRKECGK